MTSVSNITDLNAAILAADSASSGTVTIDITGSISLDGTTLEAINLASGVTPDIVGGTLDGGGAERGLFVYAGTVDISDLTLADMTAHGGNGGGGLSGNGGAGGGGAGLGGGLFVGASAGGAGNVTLTNVSFTTDSAIGGNGASGSATQAGGGGGGLGGNGAGNSGDTGGAGGGIGLGGVPGAGGAGGPRLTPGPAGGFGGGGGGGGDGANGTGVGFPGGFGGFGGGGGGGGNYSHGGGGGFGGGGGGGGGGDGSSFGGGGGFGAGNGGTGADGGSGGGGGGGLGAGGDIFVMGGASLTVAGTSTADAGTVDGGTGGTSGGGQEAGANGTEYGSGIFLYSTTTDGVAGHITLTLAPSIGQTETIAGVVTDMAASGGVGVNAGVGSLLLNGAGTLVLSAANTYTGGSTLDSGTLEIGASGSVGTADIGFAGSPATLRVDAAVSGSQTFSNTLDNLSAGDQIDITGLTYDAANPFVNPPSDATLDVQGLGGDSLLFNLATPDSTNFSAGTDGVGGTLVTVDAVCFCAGTRIATPSGEVAVEDLRPGDPVLTADGLTLAVRWLGVQTVSRFADPLRVLPIRVRAGALGECLPSRDLLVSPSHALLLGGVLVHAGALVNGTSIVRETGVAEIVRYYHVELDTHALLLAEGTPAESYLDGLEVLPFDNAAERVARPVTAQLPYPRAKAYRQVPMAVRAQLAARAALLSGENAIAA